MVRPSLKRASPILSLILAAALAGCGGGDSDPIDPGNGGGGGGGGGGTGGATVITLTGVTALGFQKGSSKFLIIDALVANANPDWVEDDLLVSTCYYVTKFKAEFHSKGGFSAKGAFTSGGGKIGAEVDFNWENDEVLTVDMPDPSTKKRPPLFVRGLRV